MVIEICLEVVCYFILPTETFGMLCWTEPEIVVLTGLKSCIVNEGEDVHFECLVSHDNAPIVQWTLQDIPLQNNEMNEIRKEGKRHTLTLRGVTQKDSGTVSFHVGAHTSFACLTVKGKIELFGLLIFFILYPLTIPILHLSFKHILYTVLYCFFYCVTKFMSTSLWPCTSSSGTKLLLHVTNHQIMHQCQSTFSVHACTTYVLSAFVSYCF